MNFQESVLTCFKKYVDFTGRAARSEFWWFMLFYFLCVLVLSFISETLVNLLILGFIVPTIAVTARRLHDTNRSGWWQLLGLIPLLGLVVLYFCVLEGDKTSNRFGAPVA